MTLQNGGRDKDSPWLKLQRPKANAAEYYAWRFA